LAEQRFLVRESPVPFDSLRGLAYNTQNYRWFFIRNSSAVWKMKVGLNFTETHEVLDITLSTLYK
uniref:Cytochrome oxidase subunit 1 n=1 Tax=Hymenolepis diminuta TaxID=6216 RepID=A0A0R3SNR8_HYMDI